MKLRFKQLTRDRNLTLTCVVESLRETGGACVALPPASCGGTADTGELGEDTGGV